MGARSASEEGKSIPRLRFGLPLPPARLRGGLTLIELLVVLTILAIMTTVAVTMTEGVIEQGRFQATQRTLQNIRQSIVRTDEPSNGISGFVVDVGRLPNAADLSELYIGARSQAAFPFDSDDDGFQDLVITAGWNGPYVTLPPGSTSILDGWGRPFYVDPNFAWGIYSEGAVPGTSDNLGLIVSHSEFKASQLTFQLRDTTDNTVPLATGEALQLKLYYVHQGLPIQMRVTTTATQSTVDIFNVDGSAFRPTQVLPAPTHDFVVSPPVTWSDDGNTFSTSIGTVGTIAARAVFVDAMNQVTKKSVPFYIRVNPGAQIQQKLTLRP